MANLPDVSLSSNATVPSIHDRPIPASLPLTIPKEIYHVAIQHNAIQSASR